ncbi:23654_t:CDS:2 [Dentiscutata erythropus]|uniref:23654_t:CDS:1 n=1 Tax=Dentiscutata erythropus TaxID=1348616 RepID=A0A9N8VX96_9GLOM|nr:23654_t:CDS:2 [Dentiscutata erythropus]
MEPLNSSQNNLIDISEKPSRPVLPRINTGDRINAEEDRITPKIIEPSNDNYDDKYNDPVTVNRKQSQGINFLTSHLEEFFVTSPTDSSIDIPVRDLRFDEVDVVLVALVDRDSEMRELFKKNKDYFEMVKHSIFSSEENGEWQEFLSILYAPRDLIPDLQWMNKISVNDEITDLVNITVIRDRPNILENILNSYPQFFINAQQALSQVNKRPGSALGGNHLTDNIPLRDFTELNGHNHEPLYENVYEHILTCPRSEMSDDEWEMAIYECLDPWPQLVAQFEEIVAYERND